MDLWKPLVVCGKTPGDKVLAEHTDACDFPDLIEFAQNLITDLVLLSTLLAVAVFIFIGFKLLTSGGSESALKESKDMAWKVLMGFIWILVAWVLVYTITSTLLHNDFNFILGRPK